MKPWMWVMLVLLPFAPLRAADDPEAVPPLLHPFAPLVGTSWIATFPNGVLTDEQRFEWVYGGRFVRNEHRVRDPAGTVVYEGETIYAADPSGTIVWWYWNTTGGYVTGTADETESGLVFEGDNHASGLQTSKVRGAFRLVSPQAWESVQYFERDGEWVEQWTMTYRPVGASAPATPSEPEPPREDAPDPPQGATGGGAVAAEADDHREAT